MKRAEIITALLEQARDKDTLANYDPNSIFTFDANVLTEAALMLFAVNDWRDGSARYWVQLPEIPEVEP